MLKKSLIGVVVIAFLITAGTWTYIHVIRKPAAKPLSVTTQTPTTDVPTVTEPSSFDGDWKVVSPSQAGYRVKERLFGQSAEAVGRTSTVTGTMTIQTTSVTAMAVSVDMGTIRSSEDRRDQQFDGRIMDVSEFPTATFTLTKPIAFNSIPADGQTITEAVTGNFNIHGVTKEVTFNISAQRTGGLVSVSGSIPVRFADYHIDNPSGGPATTEDNGQIEFLVRLQKS